MADDVNDSGFSGDEAPFMGALRYVRDSFDETTLQQFRYSAEENRACWCDVPTIEEHEAYKPDPPSDDEDTNSDESQPEMDASPPGVSSIN